MKIKGLRFELTCGACPEQYDVYDGDVGDKHVAQVGYVRLRHGLLRVDVPRCGDKTIYEAHPRGDGMFRRDERAHYLNEIANAIWEYWDKK